MTYLLEAGKYRVIELEQLQELMAERNLTLSGDIDPKTAVQIGKLLGIEYLITGAVTKLGVADRGVSAPSMFGLPSVKVKTQKMKGYRDWEAANILDSTRRAIRGKRGYRKRNNSDHQLRSLRLAKWETKWEG